MKTTVIFRSKNGIQTVRFETNNAPNLLVGDTFKLPFMVNLGLASVQSRHWRGQELIISCEVTSFLISYLIERAIKMKCCVDDYELLDQDWSQPFEE